MNLNILLQIFLLLAFSLLTVSSVSANTKLFLKGDGHPAASLSSDFPTLKTLPNYDPERDTYPGLLIQRGGSGMFESDPFKYQQWISSPTGVSLDGSFRLAFWSAMKDFGTSKRGIVDAFLLDCDSSGSSCSLIAQGRRDIFDWSGGWGSWNEYSINFGDVTYTVPDGRSLAVKIVVGADADDDMWFAYDSRSYSSRLTDQAKSDVRIDCDFSDWNDGDSVDYNINDQGGLNDYSSPAKLDITQFAFSSNLVDAFHILVGFDDVPPQSTTSAALADTDLDNNINFALVVTLDGVNSTLELYSCDDTLAYGCNAAVLERTYPGSFYCTGSSQGPWDSDSFLEAEIPMNDLGLEKGDSLFITSLISYAAASLLTSPKDSIFGTAGQDYESGLLYDLDDGSSREVGPIGSTFSIRRSTDPSTVRTAGVHDIVLQAPFDDLPGSLDDSVSYFYVVEKEGGIPMKLSVQSNPSENAIRLGFDDHNSMSALVDSSLSTISLDMTSVPADGTSSITATIVPRDSNGTLIGSGCEVSVDDIQLSPGNLAGPIKDHQDGSYTFEVVSINIGVADVIVFVEGIELDTQPEITFTMYSPDPITQSSDQGISNMSSTSEAQDTNDTENIDSNNQDSSRDFPKSRRSLLNR
jgi:hypothetical protein